MNKKSALILIFIISYVQITFAHATEYKLASKSLRNGEIIYLTSGWKYSHIHNISWISPEFNDSSWTTVSTSRNDSFPSHWNGTGYFRFRFTIDSLLLNKSLILRIWSAGKQEVYLDGKYITSKSDWNHPKVITLNQNPDHLLAVKYVNNDIRYFKDAGFSAGFAVGFANIEELVQSNLKNLRRYSNEQIFFTAITIAFGLLHLILFLFNRRFKENLVYSIFLFVYAAAIFMDYEANLALNIGDQIIYLRLHRILMSGSQVLALLSLYSIFKQQLKIFFWIILVYYSVSTILTVIKPVDNLFFNQIGMVFLFLECTRIIIKASKEKTEGVWIIAAGFSILFLFSIYDWLLDFNLISRIGNIDNGYPFGTIGLFVCMSVFLSKSFAKSNQTIIQQEKENKEREIERKYLEAENKRKSQELEEARKLQLSILPKCFPEIKHLEISAEMRTAAEVGGDYYDYHISNDGTITLTLGDATGHGIKAGILVTLIKSLFDAMAHTFFIPDFFNHCTRTIRKMNLGNLYMGLTVLKIQEYKITASAAGMPPFLIFRHGQNSVEEIILKGMPLGAYPDYPYQQKIFKVNPGDIILLLTDGFVELFNAKREMLDLEMAKNIFLHSAGNNSSNIINDLLSEADKWLNGFQQMDDISFLVIKVK
ncbi:MAG TPA: SpoIIE family protein phosphatase [Ignavibacteriaceae bacterium]|nr:SpoIIE family protein phosphatase [Ignavibacteriaceae bacterium]